MNEISRGVFAGASVEMVENLRREFIEETRETLQKFEGDLQSSAVVPVVREFAFKVKGEAHNFGMPLMEIVAQRLEDYLSAPTSNEERMLLDLSAFFDKLQDILEGKLPPDADGALLVRSLPSRPSTFDESDIEIRDIDVMLVMLHGAQTRFVERELQACGYRTTIVTSPFSALEMAVRTKPDFVVVSAVMEGLSGIELVIALSQMPSTRNIPIALITSLGEDAKGLKFLPKSVPVIHKSERFGDDLADALEHHFLL